MDKNEKRFFTGACVEMYHYAGSSFDDCTACSAFIQCNRPNLHRAYGGWEQHCTNRCRLTFPLSRLLWRLSRCLEGGVPLFSMARGAGKKEQAEKILGNSFGLLIISAVVLTVVSYLFCRPILFLFGASEASYVYAQEYLKIYLIGTPFSMLTTGLNGYINAQGFPKIGMLTTILGAVANIILDPIFMFVFDMGVAGAALATIISQAISAVWVICFLLGKKAVIRLKKNCIRLDKQITKNIFYLGTANFIMQGTNCAVQVVCNSTLQSYGGDIYVGIMTVLNSVREIFMLPLNGIANGGQPVISFNYGAKKNDRVKAGIRFITLIGCAYTMIVWAMIVIFPKFWFSIFSNDLQMSVWGLKR